MSLTSAAYKQAEDEKVYLRDLMRKHFHQLHEEEINTMLPWDMRQQLMQIGALVRPPSGAAATPHPPPPPPASAKTGGGGGGMGGGYYVSSTAVAQETKMAEATVVPSIGVGSGAGNLEMFFESLKHQHSALLMLGEKLATFGDELQDMREHPDIYSAQDCDEFESCIQSEVIKYNELRSRIKQDCGLFVHRVKLRQDLDAGRKSLPDELRRIWKDRFQTQISHVQTRILPDVSGQQ